MENTRPRKAKFTEGLLDIGQITSALKVAPGQRIIDAGCGTGHMSIAFSGLMQNQGVVYALDYDPYFLKQVEKDSIATNIVTIQAKITEPTQLPAASIDTIFLASVFHIFCHRPDQLLGFQKEITRLLKPGSILAIVEMKKEELPFGPPTNMKLSSMEMAEKIPLNSEAVIDVGKHFYMQIFRK